MSLRTDLETGGIFQPGKECLAADIIWDDHPKFKGVAIKTLVTAADTDGRFSCHLVRVQVGCKIEEHRHDGSYELHEVVEGIGTCKLGNRKIAYKSGVTAVIPAGVPHSVSADKELYLLAKYVPAMV
jgi:quercetin dioxygenase-like cupin family protein